MSALIEFEQVCKYYQMGDTLVKAADHITMKIEKGEFVAIVGQSGSGKSTCMNIIGCLDVPTHGVYRLNGRDVGKMNRDELADVRNEMLGFIFQQYNLLPRLNLMENVEVPLIYANISRAERHRMAQEVLEKVGLGNKLKNLPNQLSGGQQQRVSIPLICIFLISPSTPAERVAHINITFSQFFKWLAIDFPSNVKLIPGTCPSTKSKTLYVYLPSITDLSWSAQLYKISFVFSSGVLFP